MSNGHARQTASQTRSPQTPHLKCVHRRKPPNKQFIWRGYVRARLKSLNKKSASAETLKEPLAQSWAMRQSMARRRSNAAQSELLDPTPKLFVYRATIIRFRS